MEYYTKTPIIKITNLKASSFDINVEYTNDTEVYPTSFDLTVYCDSALSKFKTINETNVSFPYTVAAQNTGDKYSIYLRSHYDGYEDWLDVKRVQMNFVPINKIEIKDAIGQGFTKDSLTIQLPDQKDWYFGYFSKKGINIFPNTETSAGVEGSASNGNFDGGYREFCVRTLSGDTDCISLDGDGYIMPKKRGKVNLKISKYDERDLFEPLNIKVEVVQNPTNIIAQTDKLKMKKGTTTSLSFTILPENANNQALLYESNNSSVVSINKNGIITANNIGKATIKAYSSSVNKANLFADVSITVYDDTNPQWTDIDSAPKYINAEFYNSLSINANIVYNIIKDKFPMVQPPPMRFNQVSIYASFREAADSISYLFENVSILSNLEIAGFKDLPDYLTEFKKTMTAPNNKMWNELVKSLNQMKSILLKG